MTPMTPIMLRKKKYKERTKGRLKCRSCSKARLGTRGGEAQMKRAARIERRNRIVLAFAIALGADFANPAPPAMAARAVRAAMPDVTESEIFAAVRWALRKGDRDGA